RGSLNRRAIQIQVSFADVAQSPVDRLAHEVAVIVGFTNEEWQYFLVAGVLRRFVAVGEIGQQSESASLLEFGSTFRPSDRAVPGGFSEHKEMATGAVANVPVVKIKDPLVHLGRRYFSGDVDESRENASVVDTRVPKLEG